MLRSYVRGFDIDLTASVLDGDYEELAESTEFDILELICSSVCWNPVTHEPLFDSITRSLARGHRYDVQCGRELFLACLRIIVVLGEMSGTRCNAGEKA
jgi:hypothetical protein